MIKKGDTLVEVCLAIGIFSMVAIAITSVLISSTSGAQTALETTLAREEIDTQAEALRFIQSSYTVSANSDDKLAELWRTITDKAIKISEITDENAREDILQYHPTSCENLLENDTIGKHAFVINSRVLGALDDENNTDLDAPYVSLYDNEIFSASPTYPRLFYNNGAGDQSQLVEQWSSHLQKVEGIYVIAVKDPETTGIVDILGEKTDSTGNDLSVAPMSAYYDFYIRTCWYGMGTDEPSTISTVIRLNDPDAMLEVGDLIVYYNTNGGGDVTSPQPGRKIVLPILSRVGYKFGGWRDDNDGTVYAGGQTIYNDKVGTKELHLTAIWKKIFYVYYDLAGGTDSLDATTCYQGDQCRISSTEPKRGGYEFVEWCIKGTNSCGWKPGKQLFASGNNQTTNVTLQAVWEQSDRYLQNWDGCNNLAIGDSKKLEDKRDGENYYVGKLADGKCWILGNLRLGSNSANINLTPNDTNITSNFRLPFSEGGGVASNTSAAIYARNKLGSVQGDGYGSVTGVYYNYCAATAGNVCRDSNNTTSSSDICPAGWRMPNIGEYQSLYYSYDNAANFKKGFSATLSGGFYGETSLRGKDSYGTFWSSTRSGNAATSALYITGGSMVNLNYNANLNYMLPVRCVKK